MELTRPEGQSMVLEYELTVEHHGREIMTLCTNGIELDFLIKDLIQRRGIAPEMISIKVTVSP